MSVKSIFLFVIVAAVGFSCSIGKTLEKTAYLSIDGNSFICHFSQAESKYLNDRLGEDYKDEFVTELTESLTPYNFHVVSSPSEINENVSFYILEPEALNLDETYEIESVYMDSTSSFPETFDVVSCDVEVNCGLYKLDGGGSKSLIRNITVTVNKDEKLTNQRTFWQIIFGTNKDNSKYTYKELNDDVFFDLSRKSANRVAAKTSRLVYKNQ